MFEFEVIQEIEPNTGILEIIKNCTFTIKNGKVKHLLKTNLQFIEPTEYLIKRPITLTILKYIEYKTILVNFANYPLIIFAMSKIIEMDSSEQNKVALYLFNSIDSKIKKYIKNDKMLDNKEQTF